LSTVCARPWRPLGDADLQVARERMSAVLDDFSRRWFTVLRLQVGPATLVAPGTPSPQGLHGAGGLGVVQGPRLFSEWAMRALGLPASAPRQNPAVSERLIAGLARRMARDLMAALRAAGAAGPADATDDKPWTEGGAVRLLVSDGGAGRADIELWCPVPVLMAWRPLLPNACDAGAPLVHRHAALGPTALRMEALAGTVRLPASSLVALEPGDVLVLDHALAEPCQLRDPTTHRPMARGYMRRSGLQLGLELHPL
jgi:hypothetical protein